jgi:hypothetical protein
MKRPYRDGDLFSIPVAGGREARGVVLESGGEVALLALLDGAGLAARVHDRALVTNRWPMRGRDPAFDRDAWPAPAERYVDSPETFAERARALLDDEPWVRPRIVVRNGVLVEPARDPALRTIVGRRTDVVDARELARTPGMRALDLAGVTLAHPEALASAPELRVLRMSDVRAGDDLEWMTAGRLTHLYLYRAYRAKSLEPLTRIPTLRHLEVRGAWQIGLFEMDWKVAFGHLAGVTIDLGSRRKNGELHRGFAPPYPEPFERALAESRDAVSSARS